MPRKGKVTKNLFSLYSNLCAKKKPNQKYKKGKSSQSSSQKVRRPIRKRRSQASTAHDGHQARHSRPGHTRTDYEPPQSPGALHGRRP